MPERKSLSTTAKRFPKATPVADTAKPPSVLIDARIAELNDWRGELLADGEVVAADSCYENKPGDNLKYDRWSGASGK